jgi:hypothetical protein
MAPRRLHAGGSRLRRVRQADALACANAAEGALAVQRAFGIQPCALTLGYASEKPRNVLAYSP